MTETILRWLAIVILVFTAIMAGVQLNSATWPHVQGEVENGNWIRERGTMYGREKGYEVRYQYTVNGKAYKGNNLGWAATKNTVLVLNGKDDQPEELTPREGHRVNVYYAPWYPALSALVAGPSPRIWLWVTVSVLLSIILLAFAFLSRHPIY